MKVCVLSLSIIFFCLGTACKAFAQSQEIKQLLLDVEKLAQLKNILSDLEKGYEIVSGGYNSIKNISSGNFNLHNAFLNSLLEISTVVKNYKRITDIITAQLTILKEYKSAFRNFRLSNLFNPGELEYLGNVYTNLFSQSLKNLDGLLTIVTVNKIRMSDDERLSAIDDIWKEAESQVMFLRHFNNNTKILALQRAKEQNNIHLAEQLYDIKH